MDAAEALLDRYTGKYALDFAYEDWATDYRNSLHAAVLSLVESEVKRSRLSGNSERAILLAQRILSLDPSADAIELELVLAYKSSGRRAAAAEQYAHYAAFVHDELGADAPPLEDLT
jgi:two-component SAPR family response regulator